MTGPELPEEDSAPVMMRITHTPSDAPDDIAAKMRQVSALAPGETDPADNTAEEPSPKGVDWNVSLEPDWEALGADEMAAATIEAEMLRAERARTRDLLIRLCGQCVICQKVHEPRPGDDHPVQPVMTMAVAWLRHSPYVQNLIDTGTIDC